MGIDQERRNGGERGALRSIENGARLEALARATGAVVWAADGTGRITTNQPVWESYTGQRFDEYAGEGWLQALHADDRETARATWRRSVEVQGPCVVACRVRLRDGQSPWCMLHAEPVFDAEGRCREWIAIVMERDRGHDRPAERGGDAERTTRSDRALAEQYRALQEANDQLQLQATELEVANEESRVASEELLRRSAELLRARSDAETASERLRLATNASGLGLWDFTPDDERLVLDGRCTAAFGLAPDKILTPGTLLRYVHPADRDRAAVAVRQVLASTEPAAHELAMRTMGPDGVTRWVRLTCRAVFDDAEAPQRASRFVGTLQDESANRLAEFELAEQLAQFRALADSIPQLAWMADGSGWIFWYNRRWFDYTGTTMSEMEGWGWRRVHDPAELPRVEAGFVAALRAEEPWEDTFPLRSAAGEYRWFLSRALPIRDAASRVVLWFGTNTDVTAQREAEQVLRESEERYRALIELSPQIVWFADTDGRLTFANVNWYAVTGLTSEETSHRRWFDAIHPDDRAGALAAWRHAVATSEPLELEVRLRQARSGDYRWHLTRASPVRAAAGEVAHWIGVMVDIADRKSADAEREHALEGERQARAAAESANRSKSEFLAAMSHELRTPLNAIRGYAELLALELRGPVNEAQREDLRRIQRAERQLLGVINDILHFAKLEAGQLIIDAGRVPVRELLRELARLVTPQLAAKSLTIAEPDCDAAVAVHADPDRLRQILLNLLSNAIKFTAAGGTVRLTCADAGAGTVAIQVHDSGVGIPPDRHAAIFDPFVQLDRTLSRPRDGVGLGLSISRDLARAMGGDLTVESVPDRGSTFTVRLPSA